MVPLSLHSGYSLMQGTADVHALCRHAKKQGYTRLALTDTDNLYGLRPFLTACRREGLRPIVGAEVTDSKTPSRALCLVKDRDGYSRLCRLLTERHTSDNFDLAAALGRLGEGLVLLSSHPELLFAGRAAGLDMAAAMPEKPVSPAHPLRRCAEQLDLPLVAVPDSFFNQPPDFAVHRVLRAIAANTSLSRLRPSDTASENAFLAAPAEYARRFAVCPQALAHTEAIAERAAFTGPDFGLVMPPHGGDSPAQAARELRSAAYEGARRRYGELSEAVVDRLEHELRIIGEMGFAGYFLIVADIVRESPRTCGRGSGAASLAAYCLGITNVCPVRHNLYFERFLNPGRKDPPDIDVDFAWDERDGVIESVLSKNPGRAALVSNHVCFKPRMALRETARVFGLTEREISRVAGRLPAFWRSEAEGEDLQAQIAAMPRMRGVSFDAPWPEIFSIARRLIGLPRYLSVHPGGVVITPERIDNYVPVETAPKGVPIVQWEKDGVEDAGLVKIDLLGNRSLGVVRDALAGVHANGSTLDERSWQPEHDPTTQAVLARGGTMGCFYIESPAMRLLQQKTGKGDFEHLVIHSSIIRPAANEVIQEYIRRLRGGAWTPIHPLTADALSETYGLMVYQEDVSRVAVRVAGFSHAEADGLRKVMARKDRTQQLRDYRERFTAGARARGVAEADIESIWRMVMSFNGYSFCKPHSASYARVSFQAAYLKTHHPAEFMAAVISNQGGFYSTFAYVSEARRLGLSIRAPDAVESRIRWTGRDQRLRVGFLSVKDLSERTRDRIIAERQSRAFAGINDFFDRVRPDEAEARALIHCGALDRFHPKAHRAALLWQFCAWRKTGGRQTGEPGLFAEPDPPAMPELPPEEPGHRLRREFAVLGFLCERHPMTLFAEDLKRFDTIKARELPACIGRRVRLAGWLITGKTIITKKGDPMEFVTFEDETGLVETTFFPEAYHRFCHMLDHGRPFLLSGKVEANWHATTLTVDAVRAI